MFAATTTDALSVADPAIVKKAPSSIPSCLNLIEIPTASSWSPDNSYLYIASAHAIHRYEPASNVLRDVYTRGAEDTINHLVAKENLVVIFSAGSKVHVLQCGNPATISHTFESHKILVNSLSLSNDNTLLVSTSMGTVHVHNLDLGSHTVVKGLANQEVNTSIFHPHSRTRLLIASGKQIMVYDTTRPSTPLKTIVMTESTVGEITSVACSPFSKTLVAVATSAGFVGLIDLEKEKALFRTLNLKTSLTTIAFSPEGAALYLGTENGKILLVDLRALDKPPKSVILSETGSRVQTISIQKRIKENVTKTPLGPSATTARKASADVPLPVRRATSTTSKAAPSPARKPSVAASPMARRVQPLPSASPNKRPTAAESKKVLSPVRDPLGNSGGLAGQVEDAGALKRGKATTTPVKVARQASRDALRPRPSPSPRRPTTGMSTDKASSRSKTSAASTENENPRRARTLPTSSSTSAISGTRKASGAAPAGITVSTSASDHLSVLRGSPQRRLRTLSSASRAGSETFAAGKLAVKQAETNAPPSVSTATSNSRPSSSASRLSRATVNTRSTTPRDSSSSPVRSRLGAMSRENLARGSRTPSPDLPEMHVDPVTPMPAHKKSQRTKKSSGMSVLGLGTPEVDRWVRAGDQEDNAKGKRKMVGFQDASKSEDEDEESENITHLKLQERERVLSMQISPRRPGPVTSTSGSTASWAASPAASNPNNAASPSGGGNGNPAHDLLRTIMQDVMYDFQRETKTEMMGLHLDLLRMGRGWKAELRTLMDEYVGDLRDLREENQRLRVENERLRRGAY